ncbi:mediator complex subunit 1 [Oratosquilla oratoria]|uniref:mediator complex subunit 1 n=1 Tax=Oratosquilla oratoria TaxID=337810 RepID=UPI003F773E46
MASLEKTLTENSYKTTSGVGNTTTTTTTTTASTTNPTTNPVNSSNNKWQMEVLMERLRSKAGSLQSLTDSAKAVKTAIANKLHILDPNERAVLGRCLDSLQHNIKVTTLPAMVERLEATAKQLGLKFTAGTSGFEVYISCDMFYVEVVLDPDGKVKDVKVELAGDQNTQEGQSSPELVDCLSKGDFNDFTTHLEGFAAIYQLSADKKSKSKAYQSLQALETDLIKLYELAQATLTDPYKIVLKSPVGLLQGRKGGHPMRLVFFVSPYELLDVNAGKAVTLTSDSVASFNLKHYVMVTIDASTSHKLQSTTLMNLTKGTDGKPLPVFSGLTGGNSISLPACFTLKLKKPMPLSLALVRKINELTGIECADLTNQQPLLSLIIHDASDGELDCNNNRGLFVTLPDQQHCYFVTSGGDFPGVMVSGVHFTHPTHITTVLMHLRAQAAFNALIASCVRPESKQDLDSAIMFEVTAVSHEYVSITFEHPQEESTATAEIDLTDLCNVRCRLHTLSAEPAFCSDEYATKVIQRCLSIPVTMRAVMRKVAREEKKEVLIGGDTTVMMGGGKFSSDLNQNKFLLNEYDKLGMRRDQIGVPPPNLSHVVANSAPVGYGNYPHGGGSNDMTSNPLAALGNAVQEAGTPLGYGALMGAVGQKQQQLASQQQPSPHFLADAKPAKVRKRKPTIDLDGKSPKYGDDIIIDIDDRSIDLNDGNMNETSKLRDIRHNYGAKRRQSSDGDSTSDLAALREQVYGAGCAASMAKLGPFHAKDPKDVKKIKKQRSEGSAKEDTRKSPIVLDLTENDNSTKKSSGGHSTSLSAQLLKRPGIEIIPIPGSNTPISIPSSITVTPVMKSADDKYRDKKDRRDKKDIDKKDKKRKRDDSPSGGSSGSNKASKVQIISSGLKTSSLTSIERLKNESGKLSGLTMKPSAPYQSSPSKKPPHLSSGMSKPGLPSKVSLSPNQKPSKVIYSPTHNSGGNTSSSSSSSSSSSPKNISSPKHTSASPKHPSMSPKHTSLGKPSMTTLKSASPTFSKPSLSPKLTKNKEKERSSSSSPSRPSSTSSSSSSSSSPSLSSKHKTSSSSSSSSSVHSSSASEKLKTSLSDALTITKVSTGETSSSSSLATSLLAASSSQSKSHSVPSEKPASFSLDKSKTSPPKNNKKGSSLSDIVEKLRGQVGTSEALTIEKRDKDRKEMPKMSSCSSEVKKETDKKTEFIVKQSTGSLKLTINKAKKEASLSKSLSSSPSSKPTVSKSSSGLKQGISGGPASSRKIASPKMEGPKPISSLPPIPKLPPSSVSNVTATAVSPLGTTLPIAQTSPHQYQRDRGKEKDYKDKDKSSLSDRPKSKESISSSSSSKSSVSSSSNSMSSGGNTTTNSTTNSSGSVGGISSSVLTKKEGNSTSCNNNSSSSNSNKSLPMSKPPIKEERVSSQQQQSTTSSSTSSSTPSNNRSTGSGLGNSNINSNSNSNSTSSSVAPASSSSSGTCKENADSLDCSLRNMFPASHCEPPTDKMDKSGSSSSTKAEADSTHSSTSHVTSGHEDKPENTDRLSNALSSSQTLSNSTSKSTLPSAPFPTSSSVSDSARPRESSAPLSSFDITKDEAKNKSGDAIQKVRPPSSVGAVSSTSSSLTSMPAPASPSTDKTSNENSVTTGNYQVGSAPVTSASQQPTATSTTCAPTPSAMRLPQLDTKDLKPTLSPVPSDTPVDKISKLSESVNASHILPLVPQPLSKPPTPSMATTFPPSPSTVSIKIVKSPAPVNSPLNLISPHSVTSQPSPCIADDDDLMDEALMGTRK